jgi:hypothetical protein
MAHVFSAEMRHRGNPPARHHGALHHARTHAGTDVLAPRAGAHDARTSRRIAGADALHLFHPVAVRRRQRRSADHQARSQNNGTAYPSAPS